MDPSYYSPIKSNAFIHGININFLMFEKGTLFVFGEERRQETPDSSEPSFQNRTQLSV